MSEKVRRILLWVFAGVCVVALGVWLWMWQYSPLHRAIAWYQLKQGNFTTVEEGTQYARVLVGDDSAQLKSVASYLLQTQEVTTETTESPIDFSTTAYDDANFPAGYSYTFPTGQQGILNIEHKSLFVENRLIAQYIVDGEVVKAPIAQQTYTGTKDQEQTKKELAENWKSFVTALTKKNTNTAGQYMMPAEVEQVAKIVNIGDLSYRVAPTASVAIDVGDETDNTIKVAELTLKQSSCSTAAVIPVLYLKDQRAYRFSNVYAALASMCSKPKPKPTSGVLTCSNCWLAPVSKQYSLSANYVPYTVATGLNGGGYVTRDTKTALTKLFADAKAKGISKVRVSSSYRSYQTQQDLFNTYVKNEENNGLSHSAAVTKANTYSALPGHSEHQLGTTVDLVACTYPCTFYNSANTPLFTYLKSNAHKFGFIVSYPDGSQPYTGYTYEPWHIRYVGATRATELHNRGYLTKKGFYLYHFLLEKGEY